LQSFVGRILTAFSCRTKLLGNEFLDIPVRHIQSTIRANRTLFRAFLALGEQQRKYDPRKHGPYTKVRPRVINKQNDVIGDPSMDHLRQDILEELNAARKKRQLDNAKQKAEKRKELELERARADNSIMEWYVRLVLAHHIIADVETATAAAMSFCPQT
jgi:TRIAD3 protein (E3 ubiquitin-protein ligase RNF216)